MSMVINSNVGAMQASNQLRGNQDALTKSLSRLSSGTKTNDSSQNAADLAVSLKLDAQVQRMTAAENNLSSAMSFSQTQDGYLRNIGKALDRMSELAILSQDVMKPDDDRALYDKEFQQLGEFITEAGTKDFNGVSLFTVNSLAVTIDSEGNTLGLTGIPLDTTTYTDVTGGNVSTTTAAVSALQKIKSAIGQLGQDIAQLGSTQARLNSTSQNLAISKMNLSAASSKIKDVDVAAESTEFAKYNILVQSGTAMLAQANQLPQNVLRLLQ